MAVKKQPIRDKHRTNKGQKYELYATENNLESYFHHTNAIPKNRDFLAFTKRNSNFYRTEQLFTNGFKITFKPLYNAVFKRCTHCSTTIGLSEYYNNFTEYFIGAFYGAFHSFHWSVPLKSIDTNGSKCVYSCVYYV